MTGWRSKGLRGWWVPHLLVAVILLGVLAIAAHGQPRDLPGQAPEHGQGAGGQGSATPPQTSKASDSDGGNAEDDEELMRRLQEFRKKKKQKAAEAEPSPTPVEPRKPLKPRDGPAPAPPPETQTQEPEPAPPPPPPSPPPPPPPTTSTPPPPPPPPPTPPPSPSPPPQAPSQQKQEPKPAPTQPPPSSAQQRPGEKGKDKVEELLQGYASSASRKRGATTATPPDGEPDGDLEGELSELEIERLAFEQAEKAVRQREEQEAALKEARELAAEAEETQRRQHAHAREEAQRLFNEQDLARRMRGVGNFEINVRPQDFRCVQCHTAVIGARGQTAKGIIEKLLTIGESIYAVARPERPGVIDVPRWYAELMAKARFRGLEMKWGASDVRDSHTLDEPLRGAKAVIYVASSTDYQSFKQYNKRKERGENGPEQVDYLGLKNVARAALDNGIERIVVISASGTSRPTWSRVKSFLTGKFGKFFGSEHAWKRQGELAVIEECLRSKGDMSYTIIRPTQLGDSSWENSFKVEPSAVKISQGDHAKGSISRSELAAFAVEAAFLKKLKNTVVEVTARKASKLSEKAKNDGDLGTEVLPATWEELCEHVLPGEGRYERPKDYKNREKFRALQQELIAVTANPAEASQAPNGLVAQGSSLKAEL